MNRHIPLKRALKDKLKATKALRKKQLLELKILSQKMKKLSYLDKETKNFAFDNDAIFGTKEAIETDIKRIIKDGRKFKLEIEKVKGLFIVTEHKGDDLHLTNFYHFINGNEDKINTITIKGFVKRKKELLNNPTGPVNIEIGALLMVKTEDEHSFHIVNSWPGSDEGKAEYNRALVKLGLTQEKAEEIYQSMKLKFDITDGSRRFM